LYLIDKKKNEIMEFEFKAERFGFENADGIIYKGSPDELEYVKKSVIGKDIKIVSNRINFYPYCSKEFIIPLNKHKLSKRKKGLHMVYIGSVGLEGINSDNYLIKCFKGLINNQIHVYVYTAANVAQKSEEKSVLSKDASEILNSKYFHICKPLDPIGIIKEISKYDFGLLLISVPIPKDHPERGLSIGNKIASYMEAGIPFFYDQMCVFADELMKKYDLNLSISDPANYKNIKKILKKIKYQKLEKNILRAREDFLMEKHIGRLESFIMNLIKRKKGHSKGILVYGKQK